MEVVWVGPAVVREQRVESTVMIGHRARGSGMRKVLLADSDEDGSDGISNDSVSEGEGGEIREEIRARQRSAIVSQDTTTVKRRVAAKCVRRSLTEDPDVAVSLVVGMESKREEELKWRREAELIEVAAAQMSAANGLSIKR